MKLLQFSWVALSIILIRSNYGNEHERNLEILDSIPLIDSYERPRRDEGKIKDSLVELFASFAQRNKNEDESLNRGTHAKGQCFDGTFKIFSQQELQSKFSYSDILTKRLKKGLFKQDVTLETSIRLANADGLGRKNSDKTGDVRGLSFSIFGDDIRDFAGVGRQDFMMNSTPGFSNGDIKGFYEVVKTASLLVYRDFKNFPNLLYTKEIASGLSAIAGGNKDNENITSLADISYWSNIPYTHGSDNHLRPDDIVKYKAEPCSNILSQENTSDDPNYLQKDIIERASEGSICFDIKIQFFDKEKLLNSHYFSKRKYRSWENHDWIENGGINWPESTLPFYHIARINIPKNALPQDCSARSVNTRVYAGIKNLPIGSISRVRTYVEEKSRANRMR